MYDLLIIGAGPAGMAAASTAAQHGLTVAVLDEQPAPGGQIYRGITETGPRRAVILGTDYLEGAALAEGLAASRADVIQGAAVWDICTGIPFTVTYSCNGAPAHLNARALILATGALERPVPIPGWTLPGVMTAGAGQILLKASGVLPENAVLAGSGPLLYLLAVQMARAGMPPLALVETQSRADLLRALPKLPRALRGWRTLLKGMGLLAELRRHGIRRYQGAKDLAVEGRDQAEALSFSVGGTRHRIVAGTILLHQGVVPNTQITRALRLDHLWHAGQRAFLPQTDDWGETSQPFLFVAGDGAGISGAKAAASAGRLVVLQAAHRLGRIDSLLLEEESTTDFRALSAERSVRPFLEAAYPVPASILKPADTTIVCRCEEVTAGQIRGWARAGAMGPNQLKAFGRPGMGPCQGRYCGLTTTELLAEVHGTTPATVGLTRLRAPLKPVTLGELAALHPKDD